MNELNASDRISFEQRWGRVKQIAGSVNIHHATVAFGILPDAIPETSRPEPSQEDLINLKEFLEHDKEGESRQEPEIKMVRFNKGRAEYVPFSYKVQKPKKHYEDIWKD